MNYKCILFDCDGVLVDSESISGFVFKEMAEELGFLMDRDFAIEKFAGVSMKENLRFIEQNIEGDLPADFESEFRRRTYEAFQTQLKPVSGVRSLIKKIKVPIGVASSGPQKKIRLTLTVTGLIDKFEGNIFSCYDIGSWKPEPGIYLYAAGQMGFQPAECVVIEDSRAGVQAAIAGGFKVFARVSDKKKQDEFVQLGAAVFSHMEELGELLNIA
ncbi:MAG: HAD family hydrolase [Prolixibacteraceae bacterium]|nr:HAD family hydrolase [Prolixibacteraceae bacterium]